MKFYLKILILCSFCSSTNLSFAQEKSIDLAAIHKEVFQHFEFGKSSQILSDFIHLLGANYLENSFQPAYRAYYYTISCFPNENHYQQLDRLGTGNK